MNSPPSPPTRLPDDLPADDPRRWLSALADGQADAAEPACHLWRQDVSARRTWHAYHLIGDVLRSEELAGSPARDAAFLAAVRGKLAAEPVVPAPIQTAAPARRRQAWLMPAAAAAGFVVVAGALVVARLGSPGTPVPAAVMAGASGPGLALVDSGALGLARQQPREGGFIRDPRLDEYLRAHQSAGGGVAAASPGGMLRRVDAAAPAGAQR